MSKTAKTVWTIIVIAVIVLIGVKMFSRNSSNIKIGFIAPMSGNPAPFGEALKNGFDIAVNEINAAGGINGRKIEPIYEDSKCNGKDATTAAQKLVNIDGVRYLVGAVCSSEVLGALPVTEASKVIFLGTGSSPDITGRGKYFFRTWPSDLLSSSDLATYLMKDYKKISVISEKTDYGLAMDRSFKAKIQILGGKIEVSEEYVSETKDFRSHLTKIKQANPDVLFINAQNSVSAVNIAKQAREIGLNSQFAGVFFTGDEFVKSGPAVEGTIILDFPAVDSGRLNAGKFLEKYTSLHGQTNYLFVAAQAYDEMNILAQALGASGENSDKIADYLRDVPKYNGVIGDFSFDQNGDVEGIAFNVKVIKNGVLKSVTQ